MKITLESCDQLPCGVITTGPGGKITHANRPLLDWLGYTAEEIVGKRRFTDLLSIGGKLFYETNHAPRLDLRHEVRELSYEMVDRHGERYPAMVNSRPLGEAPDGGHIFAVYRFEERRMYEEQLRDAREKAEAADRAKATFLSTMSHEIRTPLHAILEAGNFLSREPLNANQLELVTILQTAGGNLLTIVNDILDISKFESGKMTLDVAPFRPTDLLEQVEMTYRRLCEQKGVELRIHYSGREAPLLLGDATKITQVLTNLVSNAVKFTAGGTIDVRLDLRPDGDHHFADFSVQDSGIGIPADRLEQIFEPFTQAEDDTFINYGGTGLGLAICRRILSACGSRMQVTSQEGRGTTFSFRLRLPLASARDAAQHVSSTYQPEWMPSLSHLRVLNVDDNKANLFINARYFREWDLNFEQVTTGREALELLGKEAYDLVILDLKMPDMNGYELAGHIRNHPAPSVRQLPLIALSASASRMVSERMREAGIDKLVVKPFRPTHLHRAIEELGKKRLRLHSDPLREVDLLFQDPTEKAQFLDIVRADLVTFIQQLEPLAQRGAAEEFEDAIHRMVTTLGMLDGKHILVDLEHAHRLLVREDRHRALELVRESAEALRQLLQQLSAPTP